MIKLIATDLDGTFLDRFGKVSEKSEEAIKYAIEKDIFFVISSGRFYKTIDKAFSKYDTCGKMIYAAHNGAWIQKSNYGDIIFKSLFKSEDVKEIVTYLKENFDIDIFLGNGDTAIMDNNDNYTIKDFNTTSISNKLVDDLLNFDGEVCRIGIHDNKPLSKNIIDKINDKFSEKYTVTLSGRSWLDFMVKGVNKGEAIRTIQERYNIKPEETMVFGDYYNDIEMLKRGLYSFAMEHAPDEVKKYANFIAKSNTNDGVAQEIFKI